MAREVEQQRQMADERRRIQREEIIEGVDTTTPPFSGSHDDLADVTAEQHQDLVTLSAEANAVLELAGQELDLDVQAANTVFKGPDAGGPEKPTFTPLVEADIPALSYVSSVTGGVDIDVTGAALTPTVGRAGDSILLFDSGGAVLREYAFTAVGLTAALAAADAGDVVGLPAGTIVLPVDPTYTPGDEIDTGAITVTNENGHEITPLTPDDWYCVETFNGYWQFTSSWALVNSHMALDDGGGWEGAIGQACLPDKVTPADQVAKTSWAAFAEMYNEVADGKRYGRLFFQAPAASIWVAVGVALPAPPSHWASNSGTLSWRLRDAVYDPGTIEVPAGVEIIGLGENSIFDGALVNNGTLTNLKVTGAISGTGTSRMVSNPTAQLFSTQIRSALAPGTSPFDVSSSTLNTNLNADILDGQHADEFIDHADISEDEGFIRKTAAETYEAIKSNLAAAVDPTANEDSGDGYAVGSVWINTTDDKEFTCLDSTVGAAVWLELGAGGVVGPGASTDHAIARWDGGGGDALLDSGPTIRDEGGLVLPDDVDEPPLNITERAAEPTDPAAEDIYLDDGTNTASTNPGWRRWTGAAWEDVSAGGGAVDAGDVTYTPAVDADWDGGADPGNADDAFDQLAERTTDIEDLVAGVIGASWNMDGALAVAVDVGEQWVMPEACTIVEVIAVVKGNGAADSTIVDVNKNGVTLFTTQANRPTIAHDDADNYDTGVPDITAIAQYDEITLDIDAIATGATDLRVILVIEGIGGILGELDVTSVEVAGWEELDRITLVGTATEFDFQNISQDYEDLKVVLRLRTDRANTSDLVDISFNNDALVANYYGQILFGHQTAASATHWESRSVFNATAATATAGYFSFGEIVIQRYTESEIHHAWGHSVERRLAAETVSFYWNTQWETAAAVSRLTFTPSIGPNFVAGSEAILYGFRKRDVVTAVSGKATVDMTGNSIALMSTVTGIDAKVMAATTLYTVSAGKTFIPDHVVIRVTAFTDGGKGVQAVASFGGNAATYDDYLNSVTYTIAAADVFIRDSVENTAVATQAAADVFKIAIETGSDATVETWAVDLFGYLV